MRFARNVQFEIKTGQNGEFNRVMQADVLPLLKKQHGFKEELTLVNKDKGVSISVWESRANADAYNTATYPQVLAKLNPMLVGTPHVDTYDVTASALSV